MCRDLGSFHSRSGARLSTLPEMVSNSTVEYLQAWWGFQRSMEWNLHSLRVEVSCSRHADWHTGYREALAFVDATELKRTHTNAGEDIAFRIVPS